MMTLRRRARTKQLGNDKYLCIKARDGEGNWMGSYYARGKDKPSEAITSAIHIVADRETPTRQ